MKKTITWLIVGAAIFTMGWCYTSGGRIEDVDKNDSICPRCQSDSIATIMYGLLSEEEMEYPDSFREEMRAACFGKIVNCPNMPGRVTELTSPV